MELSYVGKPTNSEFFKLPPYRPLNDLEPSIDCWVVTRYTIRMIKSFRHKGIERFFYSGSNAGIQAAHAEKLSIQLFQLNRAKVPADMNAPGWALHPLRGELNDHWSVKVNGNWRLTFAFEGENVILVDYQDYH
jgi:proteic killer suppression protein